MYFVLTLGLFEGLGQARVWDKLVAGLKDLARLAVVCPSEKATCAAGWGLHRCGCCSRCSPVRWPRPDLGDARSTVGGVNGVARLDASLRPAPGVAGVGVGVGDPHAWCWSARPVTSASPTLTCVPSGRRKGRLLEAGDIDGATELNVATWLGPDADDDARILVRTMQRAAFDHQLAAGDVDDRELPVIPEVLVMPVTMIVGAHDFDFFRATARALLARLPRAELVELDWAGHLPTLERQDEGWKVLLGALAD